MKTIKIQTPGPKTYSINTVPVQIIQRGLKHREYDVDYPLDTLISVSGREYLACSGHIDETEGPAVLREFKVPKTYDRNGTCPLVSIECDDIDCTDCIYHYLATL